MSGLAALRLLQENPGSFAGDLPSLMNLSRTLFIVEGRDDTLAASPGRLSPVIWMRVGGREESFSTDTGV